MVKSSRPDPRPPCPFCGSTEVQAGAMEHIPLPSGLVAVAVVCQGCFAQGPLASGYDLEQAQVIARYLWVMTLHGVKPKEAMEAFKEAHAIMEEGVKVFNEDQSSMQKDRT